MPIIPRNATRVARIIAVAVALAAAWWFVYLPHYRPATLGQFTHGIDVSHHQGTINWARVADDGIKVAYLKATEGNDYQDRLYQRNRDEARKQGIKVGAYHFFTLCSPGREQAANFIATIRDDTPLDLPATVDLELIGACKARPPQDQVETEIRNFIDEVEAATGRPVVLYIGRSFEHRYHPGERFDRLRWELSFGRRPQIKWAIWQVHGQARIDGIKGKVDLDLFDLDQLLVEQP